MDNPFARVKGIEDDSRIDSKFVPKTVVLVGNGAVEDGSSPLRRAIRKHYRDPSNGFTKSMPGINGLLEEKYLAIMAFHYRIAVRRSLVLLSQPDVKKEEIDRLGVLFRSSDNLREEISTEYSKVILEHRTVPQGIKTLLSSSETAVITTNWDNCIWAMKEIQSLVYLHGRQGFGKSIVFPTEYVLDKGYMDTLAKLGKQKNDSELGGLLSSQNDPNFQMQNRAHGLANNWLQECKKLVFWGIALNTYDSEIIGLLALCRQKGIEKEVICINRSGEANITAAQLAGTKKFETQLPE